MFQAWHADGPIYYQGVVNVEKGGVIIRYKLAELSRRGTRGAKKRVSHEEKNSRLLHGTRGFCREPALDEMSAKCRDSVAHSTLCRHSLCNSSKT